MTAATPADYADDSCALCTELFSETPEWPIRRTPCKHAFHVSCIDPWLGQRLVDPQGFLEEQQRLTANMFKMYGDREEADDEEEAIVSLARLANGGPDHYMQLFGCGASV